MLGDGTAKRSHRPLGLSVNAAMVQLSALPRACDAAALAANPFAHLRRAAEMRSSLVVLREDGPIFSRRAECPVTIAAFGADAFRQVLSDGDAFGMPPSAADGLALPAAMRTLNRGLHSMSGDRHRRQKQIVSAALATAERLLSRDAVDAAAGDATQQWVRQGRMPMLGTMRALLGRLATTILFGEAEERDALAAALSDYFHLRRAASSPLRGPEGIDRTALVACGLRLDEMLRLQIRRSRAGRKGAGGASGLVHILALKGGRDPAFAEDELVAHANVLFMSMTEPVAVALTWLFLLLSQLPRRSERLRSDGSAASPELDRLIAEVLRLLTPNALMVRAARRAAIVCGTSLPPGAEIVLAPIVAHRNPAVFPEPDLFDPERWACARPGPFDYMPFGGGLHMCIGQNLARRLIRSIALHMIARFDLLLASSAPVDWQIDIMLRPRDEICFLPLAAGSSSSPPAPVWQGPSRELLDLDPRIVDRELGLA
jgi:cytochrome P450